MKVAILDMYAGVPNQGLACIRDLLHDFALEHQIPIRIQEFDVRREQVVPDMDHDVYISTGGPGSPLESEGLLWDDMWQQWIQNIFEWNAHPDRVKKHVFLICHSFQLICRTFQLGNVCKRKSPAFGVFPVHLTPAGLQEPNFQGLADPFYIVDSRNWQVIEPDLERLDTLGATILAIEKERPHVPLEQATMAIRFSPQIMGTQFHPEADAISMGSFLRKPVQMQKITEEHGADKYESMIEQLQDPEKIRLTHDTLIPNFLLEALEYQQLYS
jgi:homoserine O-succinyltransferase